MCLGNICRSPIAEAVLRDRIKLAGLSDLVIVGPCGYGLEAAKEQAREIEHLLPANCEVWAIDADSVLVRPGARLVDGVEAIAALLHNVGEVPTSLLYRVR